MKTLRINVIALVGMLVFAAGCTIASEAAAQSVNLEPIADELVNALVVVVGAFVTFIASQLSLWLNKRLKLDGLLVDDTVRGYLNEAARRGIQWAVVKLQTSDLTNVDVKNQVLALATQYVVNRVPDALKRFGLSTESLHQYLEARLGDYDISSLLPLSIDGTVGVTGARDETLAASSAATDGTQGRRA